MIEMYQRTIKQWLKFPYCFMLLVSTAVLLPHGCVSGPASNQDHADPVAVAMEEVYGSGSDAESRAVADIGELISAPWKEEGPEREEMFDLEKEFFSLDDAAGDLQATKTLSANGWMRSKPYGRKVLQHIERGGSTSSELYDKLVMQYTQYVFQQILQHPEYTVPQCAQACVAVLPVDDCARLCRNIFAKP